MVWSLTQSLNNIEGKVVNSKLISGIFRNLLIAAMVITAMNMLVFWTMGHSCKSFCLTLLLTGVYLMMHHMAYKNFYKTILGGFEDNRHIIGNDVIIDVDVDLKHD